MNAINTGAIASDRARITVKHENFSVAFGNVYGAMHTLAHHEIGGGFNDWGIYYFTNSSSSHWDNTNNVTALYERGAFSLALSSDAAFTTQEIAAQYKTSGFSIGAGADTASNWMVKAGYEAGDLVLGVGYNNNSVLTASIGYTMGAWDFGVAVSSAAGATDYGLDVGYDLGGSVRLSASAASVGGAAIVGAGVMFNF